MGTLTFLPPDVPVLARAAVDPFRRAFALLWRAVTHYVARGEEGVLGEGQRAKITELRRALDEAKASYQQREPEPDLSDEQPGAREAVELLTALERAALGLPDAGRALDWLYTVDGDRFRAHLFANVLKLSRTGWPSLPLFTTAPPNYDFGFTETVREFDLPAVGGRPAQHWRELRIVAPDAADLARLRSNQWNRYSSGGIYGVQIEDPTAEHERQRKWIDEQESFSRGVIEGRAWLADPERTADEIRARWDHFNRLKMTKSTGSYPRDDHETRSQVDSPYYNALKAAERRDQDRAAARLKATRDALLAPGGALRPLHQVDSELAQDLANRAASGQFTAAQLAGLEGRIVAIEDERVKNGRWVKSTEDELLIRVPTRHGFHYFLGGYDRPDVQPARGDQLWKTGKPWAPPAYTETKAEQNARLNRELPDAVRRALRIHLLGQYTASREAEAPDWVEAKLTQHGETWGVYKTSYTKSGWFVVDRNGHKLPDASKAARAFLAVVSPETVERSDQDADWSKRLSRAFDEAARAAGAEPGVRFRLDLRAQGFPLVGYGVRSYTPEPTNRWDKPKKQPDSIEYAYRASGLVWQRYERPGPKSPWAHPAGYYRDYPIDSEPLRKVGVALDPLDRLKFDDPLRQRARDATRIVTQPLYAWVEGDIWGRMTPEAIAGWLKQHPDLIESHHAVMREVWAELDAREAAEAKERWGPR